MQPSMNHNLEDEISALAKERNAVILAHYYQESELQDVADFIGDSLDLSRKAAVTDADVIVFCGVRFMAEVAKILSPEKVVLIPDETAGCSLEESCRAEDFAAFRKLHPDHVAVTYINCSAEVKALSDVIITSSNAERIINSIPEDRPILFSPDKYLGGYLKRKTGRDMLLWDGSCIVHEQFSEKELVKMRTRHSDALIIAHPECPEALLRYAHHIGSTSSLIAYVGENKGRDFIVLTEPGIVHQMRKNSPDSRFFEVPGISEEGNSKGEDGCVSCNVCPHMRKNTLEKLYTTLKNGTPEIRMSEDLRLCAYKPLKKMLDLSA